VGPNNSFKPNLLRYTNNMAGEACHVVGSATQVGLTQALGGRDSLVSDMLLAAVTSHAYSSFLVRSAVQIPAAGSRPGSPGQAAGSRHSPATGSCGGAVHQDCG
jgi:hypothetical protein